MKTRQRAPDTTARKLKTCEGCGGTAINKDHHPASSALTNCCSECNGLGRVDEKLGALPLEQVVLLWRRRCVQIKQVADIGANDLAAVRHAFSVLHTHAHTPHQAAKDYGTGKLND